MFWFFFSRCNDCENVPLWWWCMDCPQKTGRFPDATKWLKRLGAFYDCHFSESTWTVGSSDARDLTRQVTGGEDLPLLCASLRCGRGTCWCSCRALVPASCRLGSSTVVSPTWACSFLLALGKQKGTGCAGLILGLSGRDKHRVHIRGSEIKKAPRLDSFAQKHLPDPIVE